MRFLFRFLVAYLLVASVPVPAATAQADPADSTTYVLREFSRSEEGCYEPCDCPLLALFLGGTFDMTPTGTAGEFETFSIENVNWVATVGGPVVQEVTGAGTFRISEEQQRLQLQLQFDGGPVEEYDSGFVPLAAEFPEIDALASIGDLYCYDRAVVVRARPLDPDYLDLSVDRYMLNWSVSPDGATYDVVTGDLSYLRFSGGDFTVSTSECLADGAEFPLADHAVLPDPGQGIWFVVRGAPAAPYDSNGPEQVGSRDAEIDDSVAGCP